MNAAPATEPRALASGPHAAWSRPLANARGSVLSSWYAQNRLFLREIAMPSTLMSHTPDRPAGRSHFTPRAAGPDYASERPACGRQGPYGLSTTWKGIGSTPGRPAGRRLRPEARKG